MNIDGRPDAHHTVNLKMDTEDLARVIKRVTCAEVSPDADDLLRDLTDQQVGIIRVEMNLMAARATSTVPGKDWHLSQQARRKVGRR